MKSRCTDSLGSPFFHFISSDKLGDFVVRSKDNRGVLFVIDGPLGTKKELLSSFSVALSFPDYFGENWDALDECTKDLTWLPAQGYTLLFARGNDLLELPREDWEILFSVLYGAAEFWREEGRPFHIVLAGNEALQQRAKALLDHDICFHDSVG